MLRQHRHLVCSLGLLVLMSICLPGCSLFDFAVYAMNGPQKENIKAEYAGLANTHFAVLVSADATVLYQSPEAPAAICTAVTRDVATHVKGALAVNPRQMVKYQEENPYWSTVPYNRLLDQIHVDQLIIVDIVQYTVHEKGNASVLRGTAIANISVATRSDNNTLAYSKVVKATYPVGSSIGLISSETDEPTFRLALLQNLADTIGKLFYDYQIITE